MRYMGACPGHYGTSDDLAYMIIPVFLLLSHCNLELSLGRTRLLNL